MKESILKLGFGDKLMKRPQNESYQATLVWLLNYSNVFDVVLIHVTVVGLKQI